ncbi:MAG TPA: hypothetical protein VGS27_24990 [Candidatus Sulfotelmatobacter sp.]|nr:hypothetical protein [Candidatus Sulfotelmatobacter sp.]
MATPCARSAITRWLVVVRIQMDQGHWAWWISLVGRSHPHSSRSELVNTALDQWTRPA